MMKLIRVVLAVLCVLLPCAFMSESLAGDVAITATVDKNQASLDDYIVLRVAVEGTRDEPLMPDLSAFKFQSSGTSSQMTIVNGRMSSKLEYNYILYPLKAGTFTIGPFTIDAGGTKVKSNPITVTISKSAPQSHETDELFVTASVDNENPYLNEQILYTLQFCRRVKVAQANLTDQPSFDGFVVESLGKEREYQKVINGQQYLVTEIRQALFPVKPGTLEITPTTLQAAVVTQRRSRRGPFDDSFFDDSFFGRASTVPKTLRTSPVTVTVKPLPAEGRPGDFKGLVGDFTLATQLSSTKSAVGESLTLTITLSGTGNLKSLQNIELGHMQDFKVYDDKPVFEGTVTGDRIGGRLLIKKALVPMTAGTLHIAPVSISYFNPASGSFKTATGSAYNVTVTPSVNKEKLDLVQSPSLISPEKQEVRMLGKDILPIHTSHEALIPSSVFPSFLVAGILVCIPAACFFIVLFVRKMQQRSLHTPGLARSKNAYRNFTKNFSDVKAYIGTADSRFYQAGARALKEFLGDRLTLAGSALTAKDVQQLLENSIPRQTVDEVKQLLDFFDAGQFGFSTCSPEEKKAAAARLQHAVKLLNRKLRP